VRAIGHLNRAAPAGSWRVIAGEFFDAVPASADLYILSRVLHDWNDHDATRIVVTCRRAMNDTSALLVIESPLPERAVDQPAAIRMDLHMLALFDGGRERTIDEYSQLLDDAGLHLLQTNPMQTAGITILDARPQS